MSGDYLLGFGLNGCGGANWQQHVCSASWGYMIETTGVAKACSHGMENVLGNSRINRGRRMIVEVDHWFSHWFT
ncbi:hypothetical protein XM38_009350 [Halomicronema hongdechloris C2206]|uniref:Uncharacterized protein n=1 Tax=Halomicronema hongdechloris C2206 TaxID=1641165 RepID=A0A1Z3HI83_9CYAN|nr:hypothetical protein XM38_009350 [Halomicronema hongdechloris C2206]